MAEWKLVPVEPTREQKLHGASMPKDQPGWVYRAMVQAAPAPPNETITLEEARAGHGWKGMDGACAWHLIERHAEGWGEVGLMMQAWLEANIPDGADRERLGQ